MARDDFLKDVSKELIVQEAMYGFVMALTFVTAVQLGIVEYHDRGRLCLAISGMIFVWGMIDMFFISPEIMAANPGIDMTIERIPFLTVKDNTHSGEKPLRTYSGPRYLGGVSDHCPITVVIK